MPLQNTIIVVNEEPYCIWEVDLKKRNIEFIESIDVDYFEYLLNIHANAEDEKRASVALKSALHHAVETFFSLLGAYIQASDCVYAWVAKCSNKELRSLVRKIVECNPSTYTNLNLDEVNFDSLAELIFQCYMPDTERGDVTKTLFSKFWHRMAQEYLDEKNIDEYNSLKHGFRVRSGGFSLAIGKQAEKGVRVSVDEMASLGGSQYGASYFKLETVGETKNNRSLRSRKVSLNWSVEKVALQLQLICMSITNIVSALKIINDVDASECKFVRPIEDVDFEKPWSFSTGVTSCSMGFVIDEIQVVSATKGELIEALKEQLENKNRKSD